MTLPSVPIPTLREQKGDLKTKALGVSQGGFSTKVHLCAEGDGNLMTLVLTPGQRHEFTGFVPLLEQGAVKPQGRGTGATVFTPASYRRRQRLQLSAALSVRSASGIRTTIPHRSNQRRDRFDKAVYRQRNRSMRLLNRLKQFRRLVTCYEKWAMNQRVMWFIVATILWR